MGENHKMKTLMRVLGNWGMSFFSPLVSINLAQSFFNVPLEFKQTIIISLLSSLFVTGLAISRELEKYGSSK